MQLSPLRYPGGKSRASKILEKYIPEDVTSVVSPFFGGGSFENYLSKKGLTVRGYDLNEPLVDFWKAWFHRKDELFLRCRKMSAEILAAHDKSAMKEIYEGWRKIVFDTTDPFERAVHYFALSRCCFSGLILISGISYTNVPTKFDKQALDNLEKLNFQVKSVDRQDCFQTVESAKGEFLYLDPPYVMETRSKETIYGKKGGSLHKDFDHTRLRDALASYEGRWVLSYLNVPEVHDLYSGFNINEATWRYTMRPADNRPQGRELIITNFDLPGVS
jgi:DNA adenine methylase